MEVGVIFLKYWRMNEGYLLVEGLITFLLITIGVLIYFPIVIGFLNHIQEQKLEVEASRILYEQTQQMSETCFWKSGSHEWEIKLLENKGLGGIKVVDKATHLSKEEVLLHTNFD